MNRNNGRGRTEDQMGAQDSMETDTTAAQSRENQNNRDMEEGSDRMGRDES